jgi:hypothetical protein
MPHVKIARAIERWHARQQQLDVAQFDRLLALLTFEYGEPAVERGRRLIAQRAARSR